LQRDVASAGPAAMRLTQPLLFNGALLAAENPYFVFGVTSANSAALTYHHGSTLMILFSMPDTFGRKWVNPAGERSSSGSKSEKC